MIRRLALFGIACIVFLGIGVYSLNSLWKDRSRESNLDKNGLVVDGIATNVVSQTITTNNNESTSLIVTYRFDADPGPETNMITSEQRIRGRLIFPNDAVSVTYLPDDPTINRIEPDKFAITDLIGVIGGLGAGILCGIVVIVAYRRQRH